MSTEAKVGSFVLLGLSFFAAGVFIVGSIAFERPNSIYADSGFTGGSSGAMIRLHSLAGIVDRIEDIQGTKRDQTRVNVNFEDKDIAYLFGLATFGADGAKGWAKAH